MENPKEIVSHLRKTFLSGKTKAVEYRIQQLNALKKMLEENVDKITKCLTEDLHKPTIESVVMEIDFLINDLKYTLMHIYEWDKPEYPSKGIANLMDSVYIIHDPYGVALVIGAWNYPLQLTLGPAIGAIAGGNCVIIKPSELAPKTSKFIAEHVPKYLDKDAYIVFEGGVPETSELLKQRFDYIFYTGSTAVGRIIHAAANKYLTPTTLELGGKSPVYIDESTNLEIAARRIMWGKLVNAGQTCVAPDYLLCSKDITPKFVEYAKKAIKEFYGDNPKSCPDYGRIINERHFNRISNLLKGVNIAFGGESDISEKYIGPTIVTDAKLSDPVLQEEIFGPILPIVNIKNVQEAVNFINDQEKPLAMYIFSNNKNDIRYVLKNTSAGGISVNDTIMHLTVHTLPFGGVGASGMGNYHGKYSYDTFTHKKSVLHKDTGRLGEKLSAARYPPYTKGKLSYLEFMLAPRTHKPIGVLWHLFVIGLGVSLVYAIKYINNNNSRAR